MCSNISLETADRFEPGAIRYDPRPWEQPRAGTRLQVVRRGTAGVRGTVTREAIILKNERFPEGTDETREEIILKNEGGQGNLSRRGKISVTATVWFGGDCLGETWGRPTCCRSGRDRFRDPMEKIRRTTVKDHLRRGRRSCEGETSVTGLEEVTRTDRVSIWWRWRQVVTRRG